MKSDRQAEELDIGVPWGVIALKCWNSRESPPVLLAHGLSESAAAFDRLVPLLSKDFYYVAVDLAGHGWSSPFPPGLPLEFMNFIGQLERVVNHFRWKKFSLIGHSLGGHIMEFFAATFPDKVERLILLDAVAPTPVPREFFLLFHYNQTKQVIRLENRYPGPTVFTYEEALAHCLSDCRMTKLEKPAAEALLSRSLRKTAHGFVFTTDPRARQEIKPPVGEDVVCDQFQRIKCPVLVILAEESEIFSILNSSGFYARILEILRKTNPMSSVVRVPGNHCVHNNKPEVVAPVINTFLAIQKSKI